MNQQKDPEKMIPALNDLFEVTPDGVFLLSAKCNECGTYFFPQYHAQHRPGCSRKGVEKVFLSNKGKLASYTIQHYMCPPPFKTTENITPYGIGLVEFPEGIQVAGLIVEGDLDELKVGVDMETTTYTLYKDEEGRDVLTWAFKMIN